jgi:hypothetical protein
MLIVGVFSQLEIWKLAFKWKKAQQKMVPQRHFMNVGSLHAPA